MRTGSHVNARFNGGEQYAWFALGASLPLVSMDADSAPRQIVQAIKRKEPERILSLPANLIARANGLLPGQPRSSREWRTAAFSGGASPMTPRASGTEIERSRGSRLLGIATAWGRAAAARTNQIAPGDGSD